MLANSGIVEVVYHRSYPKDSDKVVNLMKQKGIVFRCLDHFEPPAGAHMDVTT
ncbi:hypothetical protein D3C71_2086030 [compost metagenome]